MHLKGNIWFVKSIESMLLLYLLLVHQVWKWTLQMHSKNNLMGARQFIHV